MVFQMGQRKIRSCLECAFMNKARLNRQKKLIDRWFGLRSRFVSTEDLAEEWRCRALHDAWPTGHSEISHEMR